MNESTTTKKSEYVFRRLADSFDQFGLDVLSAFLLNIFSLGLIALVVFAVLARVAYRLAKPPSVSPKTGVGDASAFGVVWGVVASLLVLVLVTESMTLVAALQGQDFPLWRLIVAGCAVAFSSLLGLLAAFSVFRIVFPSRSPAAGTRDTIAVVLALGMGLLVGALVVWWLTAYFVVDAAQTKGETDSLATTGAGNALKWFGFTFGLFVLGSVFVAFMYIRDMRTVHWYLAVPLAGLRMTVYAILCVVFLLPAEQTWEVTNKQSRVVILLDISPSVTDVTDETGGSTAKKRIDVLIDFLTDEKIAFIKNLLEKNPVAVYAFGTRLDEAPTTLPRGSAPWTKAEWDAFRKYDFKPFVLRGLSDEGKEQIRGAKDWGDGPGTADWAQSWFARKADGELKGFANLQSDADVEILRKNLEKLDKRIDVARTITLGTNVPDSITAAVNRESSNMVQGIIVLSDGRSNLGSDSSYTELRERASREKIPVFTIAVGEDRERVAISITDIQAPDSAPIDEAWKINVEADGQNLANREVEVILDLYMPGNTPDKDKDIKNLKADETFRLKLVFAPGDPPHGQAEFVIDPAKLPEKLTEPSKEAAIQKRVLKEGKWAARARIAKDPQEAFPDPEHFSTVREINVVQQKLRILLMAGAPSREFAFLRTLLVREVQDKRATLTTFVQNDAGTTGKLTAEQDELIIPRFPTKFDLKATKGIDPVERPYNLNEYDVLIAFDPDWSELSLQQTEDVARWVKEGGGGLIYVAGSINTFQLARVEMDSRLDPLLKILPVQPADIIALRIKAVPKTPRRLYLNPKAIIGSDLLKLDDKVPDDPIAGWERFFTDRDKYVPLTDTNSEGIPIELLPERGFFSCYPLKPDGGVKPGSAVLAEFADVGDNKEAVKAPYLVTNNPSAAWRTCFLASGEFHKMRAFEPGEGTGREYFERIWIKLIKYMGGKRNVKAPRGRLLVGKEAVSSAPLRVQARVLNESAKPYPLTAPTPKFTIVQEPKQGEKRTFGPFEMAVKQSPDGAFDGYYAGQVMLDPKQFAADDSIYRVEIEVPDSAGEKLSGEFKIRAADPEMDNKRPDFPAMLRMASEFDKDFQARLSDKVKAEFGTKLPKEAGVHRLAFKVTDTELLKLIPECMKTDTRNTEVRGPVNDLWDKPLRFTVLGLEVRLLDFDLTQRRAFDGLYIALAASLVLMVLRGVWAAVYSSLGRGAWVGILLAVVLLEFVALAVGGVFVALDRLDWWFLVAALGVFATQVLAFRAEWGTGIAILGFTAAVSTALIAYTDYSGFSGASVQLSFALMTVVSLLCVEWLARKLMRLA